MRKPWSRDRDDVGVLVNEDRGIYQVPGHVVTIHSEDVSGFGLSCWVECTCGHRKSALIGGEERGAHLAWEHLAKMGYKPTRVMARLR